MGVDKLQATCPKCGEALQSTTVSVGKSQFRVFGCTSCDYSSSNEMLGLFLYAVRNSDGQWFRRKGYGGAGKSWVDNFESARIYNRIGPARAVISFFANNYPEYPSPQLVQLVVNDIKVIDEASRVEMQKRKRQERKAARQFRDAQRELERAERVAKEAQRNLDSMRSAVKELTKHGQD